MPCAYSSVHQRRCIHLGRADVAQIGLRVAVGQGGLDGEVSVAVDEVLAVEPSNRGTQEGLLITGLSLELGDPDGLLGQVVDVGDVGLEGFDIVRTVPVGSDVVDPAANAGGEELLHDIDTSVAVGWRDNGDVGVGVSEGLDQVLVSRHSVGNAHAGTAVSVDG